MQELGSVYLNMLPKENRLNQKYIKTLYEQGIKFRGEFGMLIVKEYLDTKETQFLFIVSKKIGNAVQRHRMTRLLREITKENLKKYTETEKQYRCIYVAFKYCNDYAQLEKEYTQQFKNAFRINQGI